MKKEYTKPMTKAIEVKVESLLTEFSKGGSTEENGINAANSKLGYDFDFEEDGVFGY